VKKILSYFFVVTNFTKLNLILFLEKICANFQRIIAVFTPKIFTELSKIWVWDPRSGIRKKTISDPGSRGQKGTRSLIPDPDPPH
jgi:hypothetical protein